MNQLQFKFWNIQPDGDRAYKLYEHVVSYCDGVEIQYTRIFENWRLSSKLYCDDKAKELHEKQKIMRQVIRDIHFLIICKMNVKKSIQLFAKDNYPSFNLISEITDRWDEYFKQYYKHRNSFEHYDDQVFGDDSRNNSPGWGVKLRQDEGFCLGNHELVPISEHSLEEFRKFRSEFENAIVYIVNKNNKENH